MWPDKDQPSSPCPPCPPCSGPQTSRNCPRMPQWDPSHWMPLDAIDVSVQSNDKTFDKTFDKTDRVWDSSSSFCLSSFSSTISAKKGGGAGGLRPQKSLFVLGKVSCWWLGRKAVWTHADPQIRAVAFQWTSKEGTSEPRDCPLAFAAIRNVFWSVGENRWDRHWFHTQCQRSSTGNGIWWAGGPIEEAGFWFGCVSSGLNPKLEFQGENDEGWIGGTKFWDTPIWWSHFVSQKQTHPNKANVKAWIKLERERWIFCHLQPKGDLSGMGCM